VRAYIRKKAEHFAMNKLSTAVDLNTKAVERMVNLMDARKG
jgi:hypothetical protein